MKNEESSPRENSDKQKKEQNYEYFDKLYKYKDEFENKRKERLEKMKSELSFMPKTNKTKN